MSDELDELEAVLRASGWATPANATLLSPADEAVATKLLGQTNARRLATTPRGRRARLVRTREVYAVQNSRGWMIGAQEGGKERVLMSGLSTADRDRGLALARERGHATRIYDNPRVQNRRYPSEYDEYINEPASASWQAAPSANSAPSKRRGIMDQLRDFKAR